MATCGPAVIKFLGCYVKLYQSDEDVTRNEQMANIDWWRNEGQRYFATVVCNHSLSGSKDTEQPPPSHPGEAAIVQVVSGFQHASYLLLKHVAKKKDAKKFESDPRNFFTPWEHVDEICKFAKINKNMLESAIGQKAGKREPWVVLMDEFRLRFFRYSPYLLQTDFDAMVEILGEEECEGMSHEEVFARFMGFLYGKLEALQQVLQCVVHIANFKKK